jgi:hypothetical protein
MMSIDKKIEQEKLRIEEINKTLGLLIRKVDELKADRLQAEGRLSAFLELKKELGYDIKRNDIEAEDSATG